MIVPGGFLKKNMLVTCKKYAVVYTWSALLLLVSLCYWPGLLGGFVFDDDVNIIQNRNLRIKNGDGLEFWAVAASGQAGPLGRPVAFLTFALNYYWAGDFIPFQFKLVNLFIHLLNTVFVGCFAQTIIRVLDEGTERRNQKGFVWAGLIVAALWGLHPLNLTAVLYVVQRMTSLCTLFGMAGLLIYSSYRSATYAQVQLKRPLLWGAICAVLVLGCLLLSALSKESGVLFMPLLLWTEWCIFRFRYNNQAINVARWHLSTIVAWSVGLAVAYVAIFKLPSMVSPAAYANRDFTLLERGLTQARVLIFYLRMLIFPANSQLSLYHDDFELSQSLLSPSSTIFAFAFLIFITLVTWYQRNRFCVLLYGWGWFLISHALESTIFSLELVYEHRNYFAIIGPLLILPLLVQRIDLQKYGRIVVISLIFYLCLLGFVTHVRSLQWSNPVEWAALEAENRPASARANYELGRMYIILMNSSGDPNFAKLADEAFMKSAKNDSTSMLPIMARVQLAYMLGNMPEDDLISLMKSGFRKERYKNVNTSILSSLVSCQVNEICHLPNGDVLEILQAAFDNPLTPRIERGEILKLIAQYRINRMHDLPGGTNLIKKAIDINDTVASRIMYAQALAMSGRFDLALDELNKATIMDSHLEYRANILNERSNILEKMENP